MTTTAIPEEVLSGAWARLPAPVRARLVDAHGASGSGVPQLPACAHEESIGRDSQYQYRVAFTRFAGAFLAECKAPVDLVTNQVVVESWTGLPPLLNITVDMPNRLPIPTDFEDICYRYRTENREPEAYLGYMLTAWLDLVRLGCVELRIRRDLWLQLANCGKTVNDALAEWLEARKSSGVSTQGDYYGRDRALLAVDPQDYIEMVASAAQLGISLNRACDFVIGCDQNSDYLPPKPEEPQVEVGIDLRIWQELCITNDIDNALGEIRRAHGC